MITHKGRDPKVLAKIAVDFGFPMPRTKNECKLIILFSSFIDELSNEKELNEKINNIDKFIK